MKRRLYFLVLLSSWICGVSLICLFPPVSDFSKADLESGCINQESVPELNLKNSSRSRVSIHIDGFSDIQSLVPELYESNFIRTEVLLFAVQVAFFTHSFFDVKILFRKFFESF